MKGKIRKKFEELAAKIALIGLTAMPLTNVQCTPGYVPNSLMQETRQELHSKDLVCLIEGLWTVQTGDAMQEYSDRLSSRMNLSGVAVSGDGRCLIPLIRDANEQGRKVYLGGYSLGDDNAEDIARACGEQGLDIDILFLLDGTDAKKISSNVGRVVYLRGIADNYLFRGDMYTREHLENPETELRVIYLDASHLGVPSLAYPYLEEEIRNDQEGNKR
jgi:hypothetical protein